VISNLQFGQNNIRATRYDTDVLHGVASVATTGRVRLRFNTNWFKRVLERWVLSAVVWHQTVTDNSWSYPKTTRNSVSLRQLMLGCLAAVVMGCADTMTCRQPKSVRPEPRNLRFDFKKATEDSTGLTSRWCSTAPWGPDSRWLEHWTHGNQHVFRRRLAAGSPVLRREATFPDAVQSLAVYPLPWGLQASAAVKSFPGPEITAALCGDERRDRTVARPSPRVWCDRHLTLPLVSPGTCLTSARVRSTSARQGYSTSCDSFDDQFDVQNLFNSRRRRFSMRTFGLTGKTDRIWTSFLQVRRANRLLANGGLPIW